MKIISGSRRYKIPKPPPPQPDPKEVERERRRKQDEDFAALRAEQAEIGKKIAELRAQFEKKKFVPPPPEVKAPYVAPERSVAVHEAGHAVFARLWGVPVFKAVIRSDGSGLVRHGDSEPPKGSELPPTPPGWYRTSMLSSLSGGVAEFIDNPEQCSCHVSTGAFGGDAENFFAVAYKYLALQHAPHELWTQAATVVGHGINKDAKEARDGWLKNPATVPLEIRQLYNELFSEVEKLLRDNWPAVERVAEALLESGGLNQAQIDELIGAKNGDDATDRRSAQTQGSQPDESEAGTDETGSTQASG